MAAFSPSFHRNNCIQPRGFTYCLLCDQSTAYYVWWSWPKSSKCRHIFSKWVWNFQIRDQVEKVNPWLGHINCASRVKKNTLQKDKTASWPSNPICVLICGRRSQHLVNIVNSLQIYMSKPTLFCRNRSLPASFGALLNECFLISFGKTFLFVTNCREFMINFMCFLFEGGGAVENSFSLFCSSSLTREHTFFVCFVFAVLLHFIIHKELMMDKHMQTSYILWIVFFTCIHMSLCNWSLLYL